MRANVLSHWGVPVTVILAALGAVTIWYGAVTGTGGARAFMLLGGIGLSTLAVASVVLTAAARTRHDAVDRSLRRYGCQRCGYAPEPEDLEIALPYPCPRCGRPVYARE